MKGRDNYEIQKEAAKKYFLKFDQEELIRKYDLECDADHLYVDFVGERYEIDRKTAEVLGQNGPGDFHVVLSVFDLLCHNENSPEQTGTWAPVNSLKGRPAIGVDTKLQNHYAVEFDKDKEGFAKACRMLGGKEVALGDIGFEIPVFYGMSVIIKFYESDDEFPAQATVLWDEDALNYVYYETTFYIVNHIFDKIRQKM